jgi:hypothetical protein
MHRPRQVHSQGTPTETRSPLGIQVRIAQATDLAWLLYADVLVATIGVVDLCRDPCHSHW